MIDSACPIPTLMCVFLSLLVTGCGGGDSPSPTGSGGGGLTSPIPTPMPTPTPSPDYALSIDFSGDRDYPGWGVRLVDDYTAPPLGAPVGTKGTDSYSTTLVDETRVAGFVYTASTKTYTVRWFDDTRSFGPTVMSVFNGFLPIESYGGREFFRAPFQYDFGLQDYTKYVGTINWYISTGNGNAALNSQYRTHDSIFGYPTQASDLPVTGSSKYQVTRASSQVGLPFYYAPESNKLQISIDWVTGDLTGTWTASPASDAPVGSPALSLHLSGRVNLGSSRLKGTISGSGFNGNFTGAVFGPNAREIGFAYSISNGMGGYISGTTGSVRRSPQL